MAASGGAGERRVVISGMGAVSAAGVGAGALWAAARDGVPQIRPLITPHPYDGRVKFAAQAPDFDPAAHIDAKFLPFCDPFTQFALVSADEAVAQAGLGRDELAGPRTAVIIGSGIGGMTTIDNGLYRYYTQSIRPDMLSVPRLIPSAAPTTLGMRYSCNGPTFSMGSACSSASQSVGLGAQMIRLGLVDRAIVGGAEACVINGTIRAWEGLRVLTPDLCRPFSKGRNGMNLGEGAAVFLLETLAAAEQRGHAPLCEVAGYGTTSDAKDFVRPDLDGVANSMLAALDDAGLSPDAIDYVNAHGTATHANDITEAAAIVRVFGERAARLPVSSTKPIHGHALGASSGLELVVTIAALREEIAPPTINFLDYDPRCPIDAVPNEARRVPMRVAMTNSFAFGGINVVLIVRALDRGGAHGH
ncbi:beta-ketoacyl synthase [Methylosinus sp. Sm6]|uniref:beta-ketoacyl-[acyl-carrier-protein] synthase family protein n=1 Tax=Methylosinus sp. Sm6 TaxID=2866948 RepID=UPI001C9960E8|nr:beta-ketoacyl-[acyl-carrier-protein] synthase family protein [Methylosinus sp. Sm6]MBY6241649.1 beta-ketoacyl-[acyl-carrier-protein] synthase family protein [Methylosinus sp. Sm6]